LAFARPKGASLESKHLFEDTDMKLSPALLTLALVIVSGTATADDVYKSIMPDGSVMYGESPQPGARKAEKIDSRAAISGAIVATPEDKQRANQISSPQAASVGVIPQPVREPAPPLVQGTINPPGVMPRRGY
jgi:hypothetical protein